MLRSPRFSLIVLWLLCISNPSPASAAQTVSGRLTFITLIPNFENNSIQFDGRSELYSLSDPLDLTGLPLQVEQKWKDSDNPTWNITGKIQGGRIEFDPIQRVYHLQMGPFILKPHEELKLIFPFVNLDYSQIHPPPDQADSGEEKFRQRTHRFTYSGGEEGREIQIIDIPFTTIVKNINLILLPLAGEIIVGRTNSFRLSGTVEFRSISEFDEFSRHCQNTLHRLQHGDYLSADLLYALDHPHYFGPDVLNRVYQSKPTEIAVRSHLIACQFDREQEIGQIEANFSGRAFADNAEDSSFPKELTDFPDGNFSFFPRQPFKGVRGYEIRFGKVILAPGDILTITMPHTYMQVDSITPDPDRLIFLKVEGASQQTQIVYTGPASFEFSLPYIPRSDLYTSQFPAFIRPSVSLLERQFGELFPFDASWFTWTTLGIGLLLLVLAVIVKANWLAILGWLLITISLFYGIRGSFGLLVVAIALYLKQTTIPISSLPNKKENARKLMKTLTALALVEIGVYLDSAGILVFRGLSESELSPLTPVILIIVVGVVFVLLYRQPKDTKSIRKSQLPALLLFISVLSLYDAFDKSMLALLILFAGFLYVFGRAFRTAKRSGKRMNENILGNDLQSRLKLVFGNRIIPTAILILILFAIVNDLSSTYANEIQLSISPLLGPIIIPFLAFISVFLAFASIAVFFILVYPFLPSNFGYIKATFFALFLFFVFLFGIGTDDRLIAALPNILVGRIIYYFSVPMLIGLYFDINEFMHRENQRLANEGKDNKDINFKTASGIYLKNLQGIMGSLFGIFSIVAPTVYAFIAGEPVMVTYFDLLEKLLLLPI